MLKFLDLYINKSVDWVHIVMKIDVCPKLYSATHRYMSLTYRSMSQTLTLTFYVRVLC